MKKDAYTKSMHTCLTVGGAQLAVDLTVLVGGLDHDRGAGGGGQNPTT